MSEADEIAHSLARSGKDGGAEAPRFDSIEAARSWIMERTPDWRERIGHQMLDNIVESLTRLAR